MKKHLKIASIFFVSFIVVYGSFLASEKYPKNQNMTNKASIFKAKYIPPHEKIIRVEIEIFDDTSKEHFDIIEVKFNNRQIPLQKADALGKRARKYFQLKAGTYELVWKVSKGKHSWPRSTSYEKQIILKDSDKFAYIQIKGDEVTFSSS